MKRKSLEESGEEEEQEKETGKEEGAGKEESTGKQKASKKDEDGEDDSKTFKKSEDKSGGVYVDLPGEGKGKYGQGKTQKRLTLNSFKDQTYIHVREYYEKDGKLAPGKGLSMSLEQYEFVVSMADQVKAEYAKMSK
ncbi:hypothetical protein T484DRAFT_3095431 [Baffinella frigidus]|nr:hypothetical protein T484DRAFT_3095431 [Cryptophyta sp. CCMP2293]